MPNLAMVATTAGGGRVVPAKPTLAHHTATGQFKITNYDANLTYTVTVTAGTASRSDDIITMSSADAVCTVTARLPKSVSNSTSATAERKSYTYYLCGETGPHSDCGPCAGFSSCDDYGAQGIFCHNYCKNATPSGYTDSYSEWWKVT